MRGNPRSQHKKYVLCCEFLSARRIKRFIVAKLLFISLLIQQNPSRNASLNHEHSIDVARVQPFDDISKEDKNVHENKLKVERFQVVRACNTNYLRIDERLQSVLMELTENAEFRLTHKMIYWGVVAWCFENIFSTLGFKFLSFLNLMTCEFLRSYQKGIFRGICKEFDGLMKNSPSAAERLSKLL